jgi:Pyruvate/2-oxoacid:ferredoxin oxidoreductase delta subunit
MSSLRMPLGLPTKTCLPHRGERDCQLCFDECNAAGYRAIEMRPIQLATGPVPAGAFSPEEIEQMGRILAPFVKADACVGCGICEYRCHSACVSRQKLLKRSAVVVQPQSRSTNGALSNQPGATPQISNREHDKG